MPAPLNKLNEKGEYSYFPGVTVVAACYPDHRLFCEAIYKALSESALIMTYYSLLPAASYHMTAMNLYTAKQQGGLDAWDKFAVAQLDHFKAIHHKLETAPIQPEIQDLKVSLKGCISFALALSAEQLALINATASSLGVAHTVPAGMHMTLAYIRPLAKITPEIQEKLNEEVSARLNKIIAGIKLPMTLAPAKFCRFNDMTAFSPWDGEASLLVKKKAPIVKASSSRFCCLFGGAAKSSESEDEEAGAAAGYSKL